MGNRIDSESMKLIIQLPDPPVEEEQDEGPATGCAEEPGLPTMYRYANIESLYFNPLFHPVISHQTLPYPVLFGGNLAPQERDIAVDSASCSCQTGRTWSQRSPNRTAMETETLPIPGSEYGPDPVQLISAANPVDVLSNPGSRQSCVSFPVTGRRQPFQETYYDEMVPLANLRPPSNSFGNTVWLLLLFFCLLSVKLHFLADPLLSFLFKCFLPVLCHRTHVLVVCMYI